MPLNPGRPTHSIARRLIQTVLIVGIASAVLATALTFIHERHVRYRALEASIRGRADSLLGAVQDAESGDNVMLDGTQTALPPNDLYQVTDDRDKLLGQSPNWPAISHPPEGFSQFRIGRNHFRLLSLDGVRVVDPNTNGGIPRTVHILYASSEEHVRHEIVEAVEFSSTAGLILLVLTGSLLAWLLNRELSPLRELATQAAQVSVDAWAFHPSEQALATTELAPLANALATALSGLEASFTQQERFVSDAAHELKTATAVVKSSLQLLSMRLRTPAEYQSGLTRTEQDCERMEDLVHRMLALARAEAVTSSVSTATSDLAEALATTIHQLTPLAELRQIQITRDDGAPSFPVSPKRMGSAPATRPMQIQVPLDHEDLRLLCSNLLLNAIQHSPTGSTIQATAALNQGRPELRIEDHGAGIDPEALPHIFERFYRSDRSRSRATGGAGLGLAIVKAIVDRAHGDIEIASQPGKGTAVTVRFLASS